MLKVAVLLMTLVVTQLCYAEIDLFRPTDNTGINKKEQIDGIEKYLADLGAQLRRMETKIDENALKLKALESSFVTLKDNDIKKLQEQIVSKKTDEKTVDPKVSANAEEMEKLKADILAIKNNDIEQLRQDINGLRFSMKNVEKILKVPSK